MKGGTPEPNQHEETFRSLGTPRPFAPEGLLSGSHALEMPTKTIAYGKTNLDKFKTALCPSIKDSGDSHFSILFWLFVSWQPGSS